MPDSATEIVISLDEMDIRLYRMADVAALELRRALARYAPDVAATFEFRRS